MFVAWNLLTLARFTNAHALYPSLISALALVSGHRLVRINLSEQTDISDLMGSDLPFSDDNDADSSSQASFRWCDGVLLKAIKRGDWVLLDELNLASQSVLEGLNSCLDHRASVYIPELGKSFDCPPTFRIFAAQNPLAQGGGRKGLVCHAIVSISSMVSPLRISNKLSARTLNCEAQVLSESLYESIH